MSTDRMRYCPECQVFIEPEDMLRHGGRPYHVPTYGGRPHELVKSPRQAVQTVTPDTLLSEGRY